MAVPSKKISAASARAHTRKKTQSQYSFLAQGMLKKLSFILFIGLLAWVYQAIQPKPPKLCGTPGGPPVTAARIKLKDGRHLAYKEIGMSKEKAKYKIIFIHGFDSCRHDFFHVSQALIEDLGVYILSFDRAGYGESDPDPKKTEKSTALDIAEIAYELQLGPKFYVIGYSMGGELAWTCLKYIPERMTGIAILAPVGNFWWRGFPANISKASFDQQHLQDKLAVGVAHYAPWLTYWWNTQTWFPGSSVIAHRSDLLSPEDVKLLPKLAYREKYKAQIRQQGDYESLHRDMIVGFGSWEFSPLDLVNPFPNGEGFVHLWHGSKDLIVPPTMSRYISQKLPWIHYRELPGAGHLFALADGMADTIVKKLVLGEKYSPFV